MHTTLERAIERVCGQGVASEADRIRALFSSHRRTQHYEPALSHAGWWHWQFSSVMPCESRQRSEQNFLPASTVQKHAGCAHFLGPTASCFFPNIGKPPSGGAAQEAVSCHHGQQHAPTTEQHASSAQRSLRCGGAHGQSGIANWFKAMGELGSSKGTGPARKRPRDSSESRGPSGGRRPVISWAAASGWGQPAARGSVRRSCAGPRRSSARPRSRSCGAR